ncbi:hypothetical protein KLVA5324_27230 [Klebsiella variicola subsp. variicola]
MLHEHCKQISFAIREVTFGKLLKFIIHPSTTHIRRIRDYCIIMLCQNPSLLNIRNKRFRCGFLLEIPFLFQAI